MKTVLLALVLATAAPTHVSMGPVTLPVWWFLVLGEVFAVAGGAWLAICAIRRYRSRRWPRLLYGGAR